MSKEIELKLIITRKNIPKLRRHPVIKEYAEPQPIRVYIKNTYFDTDNHDLKRLNYALRIRKIENLYLQTLKTTISNENGLSKRDEWEYEIQGFPMDYSLFPQKIQKVLTPLADEIHPIFTVYFYREIWNLTLKDNTLVELSIDQGVAKTNNGKYKTICEIELELKKGSLEELLRIAKILETDLELIPENEGKADKGYSLIEGDEDNDDNNHFHQSN